jgi:hypothetical protein
MVMILAVVAMVMGVMAPAGAGGVTAEKLESTPAWSCEIAGPHGWNHCFNQKNGNGKVIQVRIFGDLDGGWEVGDPLLGTEILIHESVYNGQPCSTDGGGEYAYLGSGPPFIPYYACHHFATS